MTDFYQLALLLFLDGGLLRACRWLRSTSICRGERHRRCTEVLVLLFHLPTLHSSSSGSAWLALPSGTSQLVQEPARARQFSPKTRGPCVAFTTTARLVLTLAADLREGRCGTRYADEEVGRRFDLWA